MKLSYMELMVLSAILRSPTRTLVVTRDHSTFVDQLLVLDALNRKDIFLLTIEDVKRGAALRGLEVSAVLYDETISAMSFTDEERAMIQSRVRTPVTRHPSQEIVRRSSTIEDIATKLKELQKLADEVAGIPGVKHE